MMRTFSTNAFASGSRTLSKKGARNAYAPSPSSDNRRAPSALNFSTKPGQKTEGEESVGCEVGLAGGGGRRASIRSTTSASSEDTIEERRSGAWAVDEHLACS